MFLIKLGEQLRDEEKLTIVTDERELPFALGKPVKLELDFDGVDDPELENELQRPGLPVEKAPISNSQG